MIHSDGFREIRFADLVFELAHDVGHRQRETHFRQRTLATPLIDHGQHPKRPAVDQVVVDEIHAPALALAGRHRSRLAMRRHVLPAF